MPRAIGKPYVISGAIAKVADSRATLEFTKRQLAVLGGTRTIGPVPVPHEVGDYVVPYAPRLAKAKAAARIAKASYAANPTHHNEIVYNQALRAVREMLNGGR